LVTGDSKRILPGMANTPAVRLLEVTVTAQEATLWKWAISEGEVEVAHGYETSREAAQIDGDSTLFAMLSVGAR
jgi:hypothetical protein